MTIIIDITIIINIIIITIIITIIFIITITIIITIIIIFITILETRARGLARTLPPCALGNARPPCALPPRPVFQALGARCAPRAGARWLRGISGHFANFHDAPGGPARGAQIKAKHQLSRLFRFPPRGPLTKLF